MSEVFKLLMDLTGITEKQFFRFFKHINECKDCKRKWDEMVIHHIDKDYD